MFQKKARKNKQESRIEGIYWLKIILRSLLHILKYDSEYFKFILGSAD